MNGKIKVLHVIKTLKLGGAETNLLNLVSVFDPDRVESHVAYSFGGEIEERFQKKNLRLYRYAKGDHKVKSLASFLIVWRLMNYIVKNKIDIVQTHTFNAHIWGGIAVKLAGKKLIEHVHDFRYIHKVDREQRRFFVDQYEHIRMFKGLSDRVVVLTEQNKNYVIQNKFCSPQNVRLIRNGISLSAAKPADAALKDNWHIPQDHAVFLTPARISGEKNIDLLFKIVPLVAKQWLKVTFLISGDGPMLELYKKRVTEENLGELIRFIGFYPDTTELLEFTYAMILPSFLELHPISILEALSMKVPVLVSENVGCNSEVFRSWENGILLNPRTPQVWAEAILKLLKDRPLRDSIASNGYILCKQQFDIREIAKKFEEIYAELA